MLKKIKRKIVGALFPKPQLIDVSSLVVKIIHDDTSSLSLSLGISSERRSELYSLCDSALLAGKKFSISGLMADLSPKCMHANELAFVMFHLGNCIGGMNSHGLSVHVIGTSKK